MPRRRAVRGGAVGTGAVVQIDNGYRHPLAFAWLSAAVVAVLLALSSRTPSMRRVSAGLV
jgi:hypothetical protein